MCLQVRRWRHGLEGAVQLCVTEDGHQVVLRGKLPEDDMRGKWVIQVRDTISGEFTSLWKSHCHHYISYYQHQLASWSSNNTPYLAHSCPDCKAVDVYDISRGQLITQYKEQGVFPGPICRGSGPDTLLLLDVMGRRILQLQWTGDSLQLLKHIQYNHPAWYPPDICYSSLHDNIYLAGEHTVSCIPLSGGQTGVPLWQLGGEGVDVGGQQLDRYLSVCCGADRLYLSGWDPDRLLVVDGERGGLLHVHNTMSG